MTFYQLGLCCVGWYDELERMFGRKRLWPILKHSPSVYLIDCGEQQTP